MAAGQSESFLILDDAGDAIFVGNMAAQPKPVLPSGTAIDLFLRFIVEVSSTSAINMVIDPNLITATQQWVINYVQEDKSPLFLSKKIITQDYTIPADYNAGSIDTAIADGVTVTIPDNTIWQFFLKWD